MASYGSSLLNGLDYATRALKEYDQLASTDPEHGQAGRNKCLVLIATIRYRQHQNAEALALCHKALSSSLQHKDSSSTVGLTNNLLGIIHRKLGNSDSADYYFRAALEERLRRNETTYLPTSFVTVGDIEYRQGKRTEALTLYKKAMEIAVGTQNRQAQVTCLLALAAWYTPVNAKLQEDNLLQARDLAAGIADKSYLIAALNGLKNLYKSSHRLQEALETEEQITQLKETTNNSEKVHIIKSLELQFDITEKDRELLLLKKEKDLSTISNYLLLTILLAVLLLGGGLITFLRKINIRNRQLLLAQQELMKLAEEKKKLKEEHLQNEIEFKESQLTALAAQMAQKSELLQELREKLEYSAGFAGNQEINNMIARGLNQDREWLDLNAQFESVNKNFYSRIRQNFPEITANELKICALIKMNLSIKEMASILNISPDSVKTARYRLRKKLNLNTEDNLTDFILGL